MYAGCTRRISSTPTRVHGHERLRDVVHDHDGVRARLLREERLLGERAVPAVDHHDGRAEAGELWSAPRALLCVWFGFGCCEESC